MQAIKSNQVKFTPNKLQLMKQIGAIKRINSINFIFSKLIWYFFGVQRLCGCVCAWTIEFIEPSRASDKKLVIALDWQERQLIWLT